jgi:hypothetical protein
LKSFIDIDLPLEIILYLVLWMTVDFNIFFLVDILFKHDLAIIQNFENHNI